MADFSISLPDSPRSCSPPRKHKTNALLVTSLPLELFHSVALSALRNHFDSYGEINQWVPISCLRRIIIVYRTEEAAEAAKLDSDPVLLKETYDRPQITLRVYRADPIPLVDHFGSIPEENYLRPPAVEKNFLISPPGSPPIGWEPVKEDPPNATPLAGDLIEALRLLQMKNGRRGLEVLLEPEGASGVSVYVEDCDGYDFCDPVKEVDWLYGEPSPRMRFKPIATALPPLPTAVM